MNNTHITEFFGVEEGSWVWCLHCEKCYQVGEHRAGKGGLQLCHYSDCSGDAVMDAWKWETIKEEHTEYPKVPDRNVVYPMY